MGRPGPVREAILRVLVAINRPICPDDIKPLLPRGLRSAPGSCMNNMLRDHLLVVVGKQGYQRVYEITEAGRRWLDLPRGQKGIGPHQPRRERSAEAIGYGTEPVPLLEQVWR